MSKRRGGRGDGDEEGETQLLGGVKMITVVYMAFHRADNWKENIFYIYSVEYFKSQSNLHR